jgi:hypothetical protein
MDDANRSDLVGLTAEIISAYVSNNTVVAADLPGIIGDVHEALSKASQRIGPAEREELRPAIALKKSVTPDYIVCLEEVESAPRLPNGGSELRCRAVPACQADGPRHATGEIGGRRFNATAN